ncbi:MAG: hypothetical protein ACE3JQ_07490 [Paenisporosarcina sp.]
MDEKPFYFDGSLHNKETTENKPTENERFILTDEMRKNIGGNPYTKDHLE